MTTYQNGKGLVLELGDEYPVLDEYDKPIGKTSPGDIAVILHEEAEGDNIYAEVVLATGEYAGYSGLVLNKNDLLNSVVLHYPKGEVVFLRDIHLTCCP